MSRGNSYYQRDRGKGLKRVMIAALVVVVLVVALVSVQLLRSTPRPIAVSTVPSSTVIPGNIPSLPWPNQGSSDIALVGVGSVGNHGQTSPIGLASVAKIITALVIIHDHPLSLGQSGPSIVVSPTDVSNYQNMLAAQDSVMAVVSGESLTEYQALQALLVPSADNVAIMLANWDAGSVSNFVTKMNAMANELGMKHSHYTDPSGLYSTTQGTAPDQLVAAETLLDSPVLSSIVAMPQATLPVAGIVYNVNALVGHDGITGVKTGSTPAGGNYVFSGSINLPNTVALPSAIASNPTAVGVVLGQQGYTPLPSALSAGQALLDAFRKVPQAESVVSAGQTVGVVQAPGENSVAIVAKSGVSLIGWPSLVVHYTFTPKKNLPRSFAAGYEVGMLEVSIGTESSKVPVVVTKGVIAPGVSWKLRRL